MLQTEERAKSKAEPKFTAPVLCQVRNCADHDVVVCVAYFFAPQMPAMMRSVALAHEGSGPYELPIDAGKGANAIAAFDQETEACLACVCKNITKPSTIRIYRDKIEVD